MMKSKPLNPKLPGKYARMTRDQLDAESDRYDTPGVADAEFKTPTASQLASHPKKRSRGRPRKPDHEKAVPVLITFEPSLLAELDARARSDGVTRAGLVNQCVRSVLHGA